MTDAELEAEREAILAEEAELAEAHERIHQQPEDDAGHRRHGERLKAHTKRVRAFKGALEQRTGSPRRSTLSVPTVCPVCQSPFLVPTRLGEAYRCLACRAEWVMGAP
jgi:hypothetical protein